GERDCTYESFIFSIHRYLAGFNNEHAMVTHSPKDIRLSSFYPFRIHYVSNDVYVVDIAREYDRTVIGQKITMINDRPIPEMEQKLASFRSAENLWTKRKSLDPFG